MRFEDWDVLLFPKDSKIPMKEFKTNCHVVHDTEFAYTHGSFGLPTMTCFMPAMPPSTPFNISVHCWDTPQISKFTESYSKHPELVKLEARVLIDGRVVASSSFNRSGPWPQLITHSFEFTKNGDLETLRFPPFRSEVLKQNYWSPGDEVGRIKIVISEGFPRDSLTVPIERVKNVVAFSFQHAPLDILESSGIAWPNPGMWRRSTNSTMPVPTHHHEDGPDAHLHSPRRRTGFMKGNSNLSEYNSGSSSLAQASSNNLLNSMPNTQAMLQRGGPRSGSSWADPFHSQKYSTTASYDWANFNPVGYTQPTESGKANFNTMPSRRAMGAGRMSLSDVSMPDYTASNSESMSDHQFLNLSTSGLADPDATTHDPKAPTNTPTTMTGSSFVDDIDMDVSKISTPGSMYPIAISMSEYFTNHANFSPELATTLTHSLLNQPHPLPVKPGSFAPPAPEAKPRKEIRMGHKSLTERTSANDEAEMRKTSESSQSTLGKENQLLGVAYSPPGQSTFSGVFSNRSGSAGDFGNDLTNTANAPSVFTQPTLVSHEDGDSSPDSRGTEGPEKSVKRNRHFTPASSKMADDDGKSLLRTPSVQDILEDHFGAQI
ncbi:hypothetical protein GGR52DRAFT_387052 [Hypoxylon sp. FL1284]|nr:hypothetical protein GGR52DRAFT_387052 [Hypoxylon sp. FL1284]